MMMDEGPGGGAAEADAEEAAGPGEVVDKKPWLKDPRALTRSNSPTSRPPRSTIWVSVRRLEPNHPMVAEGYEHICIKPGCFQFFKLNMSSGNWATNPAPSHAKTCHPKTSGAPYIEPRTPKQVRYMRTYVFTPIQFGGDGPALGAA